MPRVWRDRYLIGTVVLIAVGVVAVVGLLRPKEWTATVTVAPEPLAVPGLHGDDEAVPTIEEAIDREVAAAEGDPFRAAVLDTFDHPLDYEVTGDPERATVTFEVTSDSADVAIDAYSVANGFVAWGRTLDAAQRQADAQYALDHPADGVAPEPDETAALQHRADVARAALDQLAAGGGRVVVPPAVPDDPSSPPLVAWLVVAALGGLVVGLALSRRRDRASSPADPPPRPVASTPAPELARGARRGLGAGLVAVVVLVGAPATAGYLSVWELRPSRAELEEVKYACLARWMADIPSGSVVSVAADEPLFRDSVQEFTFPRLVLVDPGRPAHVALTIVAGDGPQQCGGYHLETSP